MDRRSFLQSSFALGCSTAASPLVTPAAFASAPWDNRLIVIILRGGMDGLDIVQPYGDPNLQTMRPNFPTGEAGGAYDLDGFFALHSGLAPLIPMWQAGELSFAHAVSTPYRDKRSHFFGQDLLEAGTVSQSGTLQNDGWLNRMLANVPGVTRETLYSVGMDQMLITRGENMSASWSPSLAFEVSAQTERLLEVIYHDHPLYRDAVLDAIEIGRGLEFSGDLDDETEDMMMADPMMQGVAKKGGHIEMAKFTATRMREETRIAAFSIGGWDTHKQQQHFIKKPLSFLTDTLLTLKAGLGDVWSKTSIVAMTEFGRTAHENGLQGTDHGTGGAMLFAGGAIRGGHVFGQWPGLHESDLYDGRDVMPTRDVRAYAAWVMRGLFGLDKTTLETVVFPDLDMGTDPKITL